MALLLCASAGKKTGLGAHRKCTSDAPDAIRWSYIQSQCVWGGACLEEDEVRLSSRDSPLLAMVAGMTASY